MHVAHEKAILNFSVARAFGKDRTSPVGDVLTAAEEHAHGQARTPDREVENHAL